MALIKCPECGQEVSDRSKACPKCGFPIEELSPSGSVKIKLSKGNAISDKQKVIIVDSRTDGVLWDGHIGQIADVYVSGPTPVCIKYQKSAMFYGGECTGTLDPTQSKKYVVNVNGHNLFRAFLSFEAVDVFDRE